ncbi:TPA: hypothetical protein DDW69_01845 [candidate division CPR2 bacterium]|uniref:Uncharacterized protein n=1 Tax=candidate division CPR2 bacterium GW2011_GWC1_41_48 TaxID=1618344 RepID=A0A0G0W9X2_UNCC2|nr:MAG: hypothetical protein UT47_C0001G0170 [candidate division CPR2 bacterium GW2011_GWC2_39_35]KKR27453.1 MAG: hypothetical protein UT59_C0056G0004 [candidate division CPR2 bacterium GW2011_GWD1_39_7]KKR27462.1 MAG: hypothetical protein UT60_C0048G0004 [candidate division CPR2 bacterium GW2011_GWD2_39_7]KKS09765.1 MAG: hypothetical protein UU65_C0001G0170 [candidate division CPR2 bacterium GW2011_GWC1_41_48]OGB58822.1 MAG: hypothetical protein A2Y27_01810 [candidate division CPR2 bacterium G
MVDEKWFDLLDLIDEKFGIDKKENENFTFKDDVGNEFKGTINRVYFDSPFGNIKLERTNRPLILDKKIHYNRTSGTGAKVEYQTSETETTNKVTAYKENSDTGEWEEVTLPAGNISF